MSTVTKGLNKDCSTMSKVLGRCPECGDDVLEGKQKFYCRKFTKHRCRFSLSKKYFKKWGVNENITAQEMRILLNGDGLTLQNLVTIKNGRMFDCMGFLRWIKQMNRWAIDFVGTVWHD